MDATALARELIEPIPVNALHGLTVRAAADGAATVELQVGPTLGNAIGSLAASGLIAMVDAAGLAAIIATAERPEELRDVSPLGSDADLTFFAPARGRLRAHCALDQPALDAVRRLLAGEADRAAVLTLTEITDEQRTVVCTGRFRWRIRRMTPALTAS